MLPPREEITWSRKLKKKYRERASKGMRHESAAQIWRSPRKLRKNDSQEKCSCQSYNCAVAKVWRIVCESNCIDEPAGENCHTEVDPERVRCRGFSALSKVPPCSTAWWHDLCHMAQVFAMHAFSLQRPRATKKGSRLCRFLKQCPKTIN